MLMSGARDFWVVSNYSPPFVNVERTQSNNFSSSIYAPFVIFFPLPFFMRFKKHKTVLKQKDREMLYKSTLMNEAETKCGSRDIKHCGGACCDGSEINYRNGQWFWHRKGILIKIKGEYLENKDEKLSDFKFIVASSEMLTDICWILVYSCPFVATGMDFSRYIGMITVQLGLIFIAQVAEDFSSPTHEGLTNRNLERNKNKPLIEAWWKKFQNK